MWEEIKKIKSTKKELREFAIVFGCFFLLLTGIVFWRHHSFHAVFASIAGTFFLIGFTVPAILMPFQKVWMVLALLIGWVMSRVILTVLFFVTITPIGLFLQLTQKDFMPKKPDLNTKTYWRTRSQTAGKTACETQY